MATTAQNPLVAAYSFAWLRDLLKAELAPYPGRLEVVARMVLAATLVMLICMTFQIPYGFQAAIYTLLIARESPRATLQSSGVIILTSILSIAYVLVSASVVMNFPAVHFFWIIASFFIAFYVLSATTNYAVASTFAIVIAVAIPLWDRYVPAETNVEDTLWLFLSILVGIAVTAAVELILVRAKPGDEIVSPIANRLSAVEELLLSYTRDPRTSDVAVKNITSLAMRGTSRLRRLLRRSDYSIHYRAQMSAVVALVGRLVDLAATLTELGLDPSPADQQQLQNLAAAVALIRTKLVKGQIPPAVQFNLDNGTSRHLSWLRLMEDVVSLIPEAFIGSTSTAAQSEVVDATPQAKLVAPDAFTNREHLRFALKGCLATSACYIIYNAVAWPGISTAVTTCLLTALSTIGSSRQKQILRFGGAIFGGFLISMGAQVFILPHLDTITGFTLLFVPVTALACWIMTSSARLSYFGLQVALAFYLVNLQEFTIQTSLAIARDRVVGILLGLFMMWLVFDQIWGATAAVEMEKTFASSLRLLAQFGREPVSRDPRVAGAANLSLREMITANFDQVRALADAVLFEFGPTRQQDLALRRRILSWSPGLRMILITRIALWKYRAHQPGFELPSPVAAAQQEFDEDQAKCLDDIAAHLEGKPRHEEKTLAASFERLDQAVQAAISTHPQKLFTSNMQTLLSLCRRIESLTVTFEREM